MVPLYR